MCAELRITNFYLLIGFCIPRQIRSINCVILTATIILRINSTSSFLSFITQFSKMGAVCFVQYREIGLLKSCIRYDVIWGKAAS